jgi:lipoate-protein ligase A
MRGLVVVVLGALVLGVGVLMSTGAGAQEGDAQKPGERFVAETAERLGVTPEELTSAMTEAQFEIIDDGVAEGRLTEEQAANLKARIEEYGPLSVIGRRNRDGKGLCHGARLVTGAAAEVLGKEPAEVAAAVKSGESLAEQAEAQGMSVEDFKAALLDAIKRMLQAKVDEGTITQVQADRIFAGIEENIDRIVNFEGQEGRGPCHRRGDRGERPAQRDLPAEMAPVQ